MFLAAARANLKFMPEMPVFGLGKNDGSDPWLR